jgi:hypothetical protein
MKTARIIAPFLLLSFLFSCSAPDTKEAYIENFEQFVDNVEVNYKTYDEGDWKEANEKFEKFTGEWYSKFENDFTLSDEIVIKGLEARFYIFKAADETTDYFEEHLKDDYEELRDKVEYYIENDMKEDLEQLLKNAKEAGDSAVVILEGIIEDFEKKK